MKISAQHLSTFVSSRGDRAPVASAAPGAGHLLALLRDGAPRTRSEIAAITGLARSTVAQRIDALLASGLIVPAGDALSTGGRPPSQFRFNPKSRVVLAADVGATHVRVGLTDLTGQDLRSSFDHLDIAAGPEVVLNHVVTAGRELLAEEGTEPARLLGIGIGLPGPIEHPSGRPISPPIMPGWDQFPVSGYLQAALGCRAAVDNDVNLMALGERFAGWPDVDHLVYVKAATGIGSGIISGGVLQRGAQGAAGDIGHMQVPDANGVLCRCGNIGCLEAVAGATAVAKRLSQVGIPLTTAGDVGALARSGSVEVMQVLRDAGRQIGGVVSALVSVLNPSVIVIGGSLAEAGEHLIAGVREVVYHRAMPLATQNLPIAPASTGNRAAIIGAAVLIIEQALSPAEVDRLMN